MGASAASATGTTGAQPGGSGAGSTGVDLHFALGGTPATAALTLLVGTNPVPLTPETPATRAQLAQQLPLLGSTGLAQFTHVAQGVTLPSSAPLQCTVVDAVASDGTRRALASKVVVPAAAQSAVWGLLTSTNQQGLLGSDARLAALGIGTSGALTQQTWDALNVVSTDTDTAAALVFKHPLILSLNDHGAAITLGLISALTSLGALAAQIGKLRGTSGGYRTDVPVTLAGEAVQFPPAGYVAPPPTVAPPPVQAKAGMVDDSLTPLIAACVKEAVARLRNSTALLQANQRTVADLVAPPIAAQPAATVAGPTGSGLEPSLSGQCVDGEEHGVQVALVGGATNPRLTADLKVTNNYARFLGIYVQYFDGSGKQVHQVPQGLVDTDYAQSIAVGMPINIISGIPIPDSSTSTFTVTLPDGATSARVLYVGLGNSRFDSPDWSSYFVDSSGGSPYSALYNPPEAKLAIALTSVINLGFPAVLLVMDTIAAAGYQRAVDAIKEEEGDINGWVQEVNDLVAAVQKFEKATSVVSTLMSMISGTLKWSDEQAAEKESQGNFLESALGLLKAVTIAFAKFIGLKFLRELVTLMIEAAGAKAVEAIPIVGEAFAAAAALVDAATLAEGSYAVATSPWVMATEVTYTYQMDVTVRHDPKSASLPPQAQSFRLTLQIAPDATTPGGAGAAAGRVLTIEGSVAQYKVTAPDGGEQLVARFANVPLGGRLSVQVAMWSGTTPGQGWQAAGGASPWYSNDDPHNLPSPVFSLVQNLVPITAQSSLKIYDTTVYSPDPTVYDRWVFQPSPTGNDWTAASLTHLPPQIPRGPVMQALGNITFSSPSNAVGFTFQAWDNLWLLRSYALRPPLSPDIDKVPSVRFAGPYPRRPWILYDPLEQDPATGQHFILEPASPTGYQVRRVSLVGSLHNSADGDPFTIDTTTSWGCFLVDLDDVAIYHQGFIVGVSTAFGTLAVLRLPTTPAPNGQAQKANGYAGPSLDAASPPGLLAQPTQVAVSLDGTVLVLESGRNRLQAFDLTGKPLARFAPQAGFPNGSPFASLVTSDRQYLGLSTDGGGAIYVLSVPAAGAASPQDYRIDVYAPQGSLVYTASGINVGDIVVDYFRNVHGLNYYPLSQAPFGIDVPKLLQFGNVASWEPSVSSWYTTAPGATQPPAGPDLQ